MAQETFGARLRKARTSAGLTQRELAKKIGVTRGETVSDWERGVRQPTGENLTALADALTTTVEKLRTGAPPTGDTLPPAATRDEALHYAVVRMERVLDDLRGLISPGGDEYPEDAIDQAAEDPRPDPAKRRRGEG